MVKTSLFIVGTSEDALIKMKTDLKNDIKPTSLKKGILYVDIDTINL